MSCRCVCGLYYDINETYYHEIKRCAHKDSVYVCALIGLSVCMNVWASSLHLYCVKKVKEKKHLYFSKLDPWLPHDFDGFSYSFLFLNVDPRAHMSPIMQSVLSDTGNMAVTFLTETTRPGTLSIRLVGYRFLIKLLGHLRRLAVSVNRDPRILLAHTRSRCETQATRRDATAHASFHQAMTLPV